MKLELIKADVAHFIKNKNHPHYEAPWDWIYGLQQKYQGKRYHAEHIVEQLEGRFHATHTRRLWKRAGYEPARMIMAYAAEQPEEVTYALNDLLDESQELPDRLDRFDYYMDAINGRQKAEHIDWTYAWHHQDHGIMTYYLALAHPDRYGYYLPDLHATIVQRYGARELAPGAQVDRYQKMMRIMGKYLFEAMPQEEHTPTLLLVNEMLLNILGKVADPMADR